MAVSIAATSSGEPLLELNGQDMQATVAVHFSPSVPSQLFQKIASSPRFVSWINSYLPRPRQRLSLQSVTFQTVEVNDDQTVGFIKLYADVVRAPENTQVGGVVLLQGPSVAVLVVFRVNPDGTSGSENAPVYRPSDAQATMNSTGPRPREYVLLVKQARPAVGAPEHREIPSGQLGLDGLFTGPAFVAIHHACGLRMYENQMEDLTSLALSVKRSSPQRSLGVSLSPGAIDERVRLYLYRETVTRDFIESFQKHRTDGSSSLISVDLWTLNDAWRITSDAKTLSSLFLFHELRYHQLMPRYRQPREVKKSPQFTSVADLNPNQSGLNLKVKVAESLRMALAFGTRESFQVPPDGRIHHVSVSLSQQIPHPTRDGVERGIVVVGDASGIVSLSLDASQTTLVSGFARSGTPLFLRNVEFDMSDGHITIILDSFGKVSMPTDEELNQFNFTVNMSNDVSATEYEKVFQAEGSPTYPSYPTGLIRNGRGGRPRGNARGRKTWNLSA